MIIITKSFKTFDKKVNKINSLAKKKYYLQETLKKINEAIDLTLWSLKYNRNKYIEMLSKYPTARDSGILEHISYSLRISLPREKNFKLHVLTLIAELER